MKNRLLLSLLATLGFVGCGDKNEEIPDNVLSYGPIISWDRDIPITTQVSNEEGKPINGIRVVFSYPNEKDSLITDTTYTATVTNSTSGKKDDGVAVNKAKFGKYPPKDRKWILEYTDVDGEENGSYQTKTVFTSELQERKVTLFKKKAE